MAHSFSVEFWVNDAQTPSSSGLLGWSGGVKIWYSSGTLYAHVTDIDGGQHNLSASRPSPNTWHHIALTYDGASGGGRLYVDGVIAASSNLGV